MILANPDSVQTAAWIRAQDSARTAMPPAVLVQGAEANSGVTRLTVSNDESKAVSINIALPVDEWTTALEREFLSLAKGAALVRLTPEEKKRLQSLQATRRRIRHPRTGQEVIWEFKQRQVTRELVNALQAYVRFHGAENNPWAKAQENVQQ
ncbi:MAG: hypothetical protein M3463_14280 [Verrucomicrobiota bacterium]|nr:hypothetical protein [Verrucomicrobiota bacterium]